MMTDPISDMLARLRNAQAQKQRVVLVPASRMKRDVLSVLQTQGYVESVEDTVDKNKHPAFSVTLKYFRGKPVISEMYRVSKPGRRVYAGKEELPKTRNGLGITIVTTSRGIMTDAQARAQNVGGEIICQVF